MSHTLQISDDVYERLEANARACGFANAEEMLEAQIIAFDLRHREAAVRRIDSLREQLFKKYGEMPDSAKSIHEDRSW